jgi:hypothetical protein
MDTKFPVTNTITDVRADAFPLNVTPSLVTDDFYLTPPPNALEADALYDDSDDGGSGLDSVMAHLC